MILPVVVFAVILLGGIIFGENNIQLFTNNYEVFFESALQIIREEVFIPAIILEEELGFKEVWIFEEKTLEIQTPIRHSWMVMGKRGCT